MLADVEVPPSISGIKKHNPKAFQPLSPPPQLSQITAPQPRSKQHKKKIPYLDIDQLTQRDAEVGNYSDMDESMFSLRYQYINGFLIIPGPDELDEDVAMNDPEPSSSNQPSYKSTRSPATFSTGTSHVSLPSPYTVSQGPPQELLENSPIISTRWRSIDWLTSR